MAGGLGRSAGKAGGLVEVDGPNRIDVPTAPARPVIGPGHRSAPASGVGKERRDAMTVGVNGKDYFKFDHVDLSLALGVTEWRVKRFRSGCVATRAGCSPPLFYKGFGWHRIVLHPDLLKR